MAAPAQLSWLRSRVAELQAGNAQLQETAAAQLAARDARLAAAEARIAACTEFLTAMRTGGRSAEDIDAPGMAGTQRPADAHLLMLAWSCQPQPP